MMAAVMKHIEDAGLRAEIDALAGPQYLQQIENVLPRYDAMVRERLQREVAAAEDHGELARALQAAIVDYANKVSGLVDLDDPATIEMVKRALRPIDAHREAAARRAQGAGKGEPAPPAKVEGKPAEPKAEPSAAAEKEKKKSPEG